MDPSAATLPNPTDPSDVEALGEQIAELAAQITAATYRLLTLIREFDEREGWNCGFATCAHWLSWRTGLALGASREHVRVGRALGELPRLSEAMRRGRISYSKVRALTRVATPANEEELLAFAEAGTATHVERLVRAWRRVDRIEEREQEALRHASRYLSLWTDEDGMVVVRGRLDPEAGAALIKAVEAGCDVLYDEEREKETASQDGVPASQRRADALGRVAEAALAGGLDKGTRGDRYQVVVHVDAPVLAEEDVPAGTRCGGAQPPAGPVLESDRDVPAGTRSGPEASAAANPANSVLPSRGDVPAGTSADRPPRESGVPAGTSGPDSRPGQSAFENGAHVPAGTSRRIACDASKVVMTHDSAGNILDLGRKTRIISPALRRALEHRDRGCRFPGCGVGFCDAHHVRHWARGGETRLDNLVLLCRKHHRALHEEGYRLERGSERGSDGEFRFLRPDGRPIPEAPPPPAVADDALAALARQLIEAGVDLDELGGDPRWDGGGLDLAWAVDGLRSIGAAPG